MSILQGIRNLQSVINNKSRWERLTFGMALTQGAIGGIIHNQKGGPALDPEFQDPHDMGMDQMSDGTSLSAKLVYIFTRQLRVEHLDSCLRTEMDMLTQIHLSK